LHKIKAEVKAVENNCRFEEALYGVSERIRDILISLPQTVKNSTEEIRLRANMPIALTVSGDTVFITRNSRVAFTLTPELPKATLQDISESFKLLCGGSVYAHTNELKNGFIMMRNGCRAGVCGSMGENGVINDITSVNIRIAREIKGCANSLVKAYYGAGLLIAGPPGSGKTTLLRDLVRQLSYSVMGKYKRVAVIDSRGEISRSFGGGAINDLGPNTDVLFTPDKAAGIEMAVRTMFPEVIAFDEIGTTEELKKVQESFFSGVEVLTTAHIGSLNELSRRKVTAELLKSGAISQVAVLPTLHGGDIRVISVKELLQVAV